jgi:hypothetical protein
MTAEEFLENVLVEQAVETDSDEQRPPLLTLTLYA